MTIDNIKEKVANVAEQYPIKQVLLFGSRAEGTNKEDSDVDLIMEFYEPVTLIVLSSIRIQLEEMLGTASLEIFLDDEKLKRAVSMTVINIGELIKNITDETRQEYKYVPWKAIAGIRGMLLSLYIFLKKRRTAVGQFSVKYFLDILLIHNF